MAETQNPGPNEGNWQEFWAEYLEKVAKYEDEFQADLSFFSDLILSSEPINTDVENSEKLARMVYGDPKVGSLKKKYRRLGFIYHPDHVPNNIDPEKQKRLESVFKICCNLKEAIELGKLYDIDVEAERDRYRQRARKAAGFDEDQSGQQNSQDSQDKDQSNQQPPQDEPKKKTQKEAVPHRVKVFTNRIGKPIAIKIDGSIFEIGDKDLMLIDRNTGHILKDLELMEIHESRLILRDQNGDRYPMDFTTVLKSNKKFKFRMRNEADYEMEDDDINTPYNIGVTELKPHETTHWGFTKIANHEGKIVLTTGLNHQPLMILVPDLATHTLYAVDPLNSSNKIAIEDGSSYVFGTENPVFSTLSAKWISKRHLEVKYSARRDEITLTDCDTANRTYIRFKY